MFTAAGTRRGAHVARCARARRCALTNRGPGKSKILDIDTVSQQRSGRQLQLQCFVFCHVLFLRLATASFDSWHAIAIGACTRARVDVDVDVSWSHVHSWHSGCSLKSTMKSTRRVYNRPQDDSVVLEEQVGAPSATSSFLRAVLCWRFASACVRC